MGAIAWHTQARPLLELKTQPRFGPVGYSACQTCPDTFFLKIPFERSANLQNFAYFHRRNKRCLIFIMI
jgi:hypothetical protein